ncbi:MAG: efflux RND transporter permease subunit, partial [Myxococcota bacterium]
MKATQTPQGAEGPLSAKSSDGNETSREAKDVVSKGAPEKYLRETQNFSGQKGTQSPPRGPVSWMARNPVAANIALVILLVGGLLSLPRLRQEIFPEFQLDFISVSVVYRGADATAVESGILLAMEEALSGVDGTKEVSLTARESLGTAMVEIAFGANPDKVLADVRSAVDGIKS